MNQNQTPIKLIECPRDAMQGLNDYIPTDQKAAYINSLLQVGYDTIDFGSFVSPKAIPQMADTADVLSRLDLSNTKSKLLAIVANRRGAEQAIKYDEITYLGYPFSISETFQLRNTNSTIEKSVQRLLGIKELADTKNKELVVYISMGFGNPYGDPYSPEIVIEWVEKLTRYGINIFSLSDTVGVAQPDTIAYLFQSLIPALPDVEFGAHLHTAPHNWKAKVDAAFNNGCKRFDAAIKGYGGCPMAKDDLIGNMATEYLVNYFNEDQLGADFNEAQFERSMRLALEVFPTEH